MPKKCVKCNNDFDTVGIQCEKCRRIGETTFSQRHFPNKSNYSNPTELLPILTKLMLAKGHQHRRRMD
jgi:hypothetical protein